MQNQSPNQPEQEQTFAQKLEMARGVMTFVALTVVVFLRRNVGYRFLTPIHLIAMTAALFVVAAFAQHTEKPEALMLYAVLMLIVGLGKRFVRWMEIRRGIKQHSQYIGDSVFELQFVPQFLKRNRRFTRWFDPLACVAIGFYLLKISPALGGWLIFSGFALRVLEDTVYRREFNHSLDTVDGIVSSEVQADTVERFSEPSAQTQQEQNSDGGLPTGLSLDLQQRISGRKNQRP